MKFGLHKCSCYDLYTYSGTRYTPGTSSYIWCAGVLVCTCRPTLRRPLCIRSIYIALQACPTHGACMCLRQLKQGRQCIMSGLHSKEKQTRLRLYYLFLSLHKFCLEYLYSFLERTRRTVLATRRNFQLRLGCISNG